MTVLCSLESGSRKTSQPHEKWPENAHILVPPTLPTASGGERACPGAALILYRSSACGLIPNQ